MNYLFTALTSAVVGVLLLVGGYYEGIKEAPQDAATTQIFGSTFTPVGGQTYTLSGSGITSTQNTIPLTSFTTPDGRALTMSMFGSIGYGVVDPNSPTKIEDITFTGITQNANGTAVLTGVSRGMDFVTPYLASSTLAYAHSGGSYFILSNTAGFYGQQFLFANGAGSSTATLSFSPTSPPQYYPSVGLQSSGTYNATTSELASIAYVNAIAISGVSNATSLVKGIVQLATAAQAALGTAIGSTGASLDLPASIATSTPYNSGSNVVPVTGTNEKLAQAFLDLTQGFVFSTTTSYVLNSGALEASSSTNFPASAKWNGVSYTLPSSQGVANTVLTNNGSGVESWAAPLIPHYSLISANAVIASGAGTQYATSSILTIPAGTLTASSTWSINANINCQTSTSHCVIYLRDNGGTTIATCDFGSNSINLSGELTMFGANQSSLVSQSTFLNGWLYGSGTNNDSCQLVSTSAFNTANALNLVLVAQSSGSQQTGINQYSIVVNP